MDLSQIIVTLCILNCVYVTILILHVYRHRIDYIKNLFKTKSGWKMILYLIVVLWDAHAHIWYSYEIEGLENIPDKGPALIIYYHGVLPLDITYLSSKFLIEKKRPIHMIVDHFWFILPGFKYIMKDLLQTLTGPVEECVGLLNGGNILAVAPGGSREALFGDNRYQLLWNKRMGFARIAIKAKVPIIPMFTQNIRETYITLKWLRCITRPLYEWCRLPCVPFLGGFPVKLTTIIGKPIPFDPKLTVEELAQKSKESIDDLIHEHQKIPGSIWKALCHRFIQKLKWDFNNNKILMINFKWNFNYNQK